MEPFKKQIQQKRELWDVYQPPVSGEIVPDEVELLRILKKLDGVVTAFELRARSPKSGEAVDATIKSLQGKNLIQLKKSRDDIVVCLSASGEETLNKLG